MPNNQGHNNLTNWSRREIISLLGGTIVGSVLLPCPNLLSAETISETPNLVIADIFGLPEETPETFVTIAARSHVLVAQLVQGLSYIGQPSDYVVRYDVKAFT